MKSGDLKIQRLLLEIVTGDEENYKADETFLSSIINESLNAVLEEFYADRAADNKQTQIEKWELELGIVSWPINKSQIIQRLREQIRPLIEQDISSIGNKSEVKSELEIDKNKPESGSESEVLLFFLKNGHLPWYASSLPEGKTLANPELISAISKFILQNKNGTGIQRLLRQYNFSELSLLTSGLIASDKRDVLLELNQLIEALFNSESQSQKRVAADLLRNIILDLVKGAGKIKPLAEFIGEYFQNNRDYKDLIQANQIDYSSTNRTESIRKLIDEAYLIYERNKPDDKALNPEVDSIENYQIIIQYLSFGSLPIDANKLTKEDMDGWMTDFILKNENILYSIFNTNSAKRENIYRLLVNLPQGHLKSLLKFIAAKLGGNEQPLKALLLEFIASPAIANEEKAVAAGIIMKRLLKQPLSIPNIQRQGKELLTGSENERLNNLLSKDILRSEVSSDTGSGEGEFNSEINAVYFSDLLHYVLQNSSWPWWGGKYLQTFGELNLPNNFTLTVSGIINRFKALYSSEFVTFSKVLLQSSQKPSVFFSKIDWGNAKVILNAALPSDKITFVEMVEALLEILAAKGSVSFETNIAVQQFVLFMLDKKLADNDGFVKVINDFIIGAAIKLDLPLWSVYGLIINNAEELKLKIGYSKSEIAAIFSYTDEREEKYAELKLKNKKDNRSLFLNSSDFVLSSDAQESSILDYLSGNNSAISIFPSPWALGHFLVSKIKDSSSLRDKLTQFLVAKDSESIHRLVELESLSGQMWVDRLLPELENTDLQHELFELLSETLYLREKVLRNIIRVAFIKENYTKNREFSISTLRKIIEDISGQIGVKASIMEYGIISTLSLNTALADKLRVRLKIPKDQTDAREIESESFVDYLRITQTKKLIVDLLTAFRGLTNEKSKNDIFDGLFKLKDKEGLLAWLLQSIEFESKGDLLRVIRELPDSNQISKTIELIKTEFSKTPLNLDEAVANPFLTEVRRNSLLAYLNAEREFYKKEELLRLMQSLALPQVKDIERVINNVEDHSVRKNLRELMRFNYDIKTQVNPIQATSNNLSVSDGLASKLKSLINFVEQQTYFLEKEELIRFITKGNFESKREFESRLTGLTNQLVKARIEAYFNANFIEADFPKREGNTNEASARAFLSERSRKAFLSYLNTELEFPEKNELLQVMKSDRQVKISDVEGIINNVKDKSIQKNLDEAMRLNLEIKTPSDPMQFRSVDAKNSKELTGKLQSLINFIGQQAYFLEKEELIKFITRGKFATKSEMEQGFLILTDSLVKSRIDTYINLNFFETDFNASLYEVLEKESLEKMLWWKEQLKFEVPVIVKDAKSSSESAISLESPSRGKDEQKNKQPLVEIVNPKIFSFLDNSSKENPLQLPPILTQTEKDDGSASSDNSKAATGALSEKQDAVKIDRKGRASGDKKPEIISPAVFLSETSKNTLDSETNLSPSSIADIAVYFLLNLELPWWSTVKGLSEFERKLQALSISEPLILRQKLIGIAKLNKEYIENIYRALFNETDVIAIDFLAREELEVLLNMDLEFLSTFVKANNENPQLEKLLRDIISKFQSDSALPSETIAAFRTTVLIALHETLPDALALLKEFHDKNKVPIAEDYVILSEALLQKSRIKERQEKGAKLFLKGLENKYNALGMDKGISITDNLFSIYKRKDKQPIEELIHSWLSMLETVTGISSEKMKQEIVTALIEKTNEQASFIEKAFINLAASEKTVIETQLFPYSSYLSALSLIVDRLAVIEPRQRLVSLNLFAKLIMAKEMEYSMALPLSLFLSYLASAGVEKADLAGIIMKLKLESKNSELKQIFDVVLNALNDNYIKETYASPSIKKAEEQKETEHASITQIDAIVKLFQRRIPVLDRLVSGKVLTKVDQDKKQEITAKTPKKQVELDLKGRIYIPNAGLVLLWPFLSRLFSNLKYTDKGQFIDNEKRLRAIYLSQYLVGFTENDPEYTLMLNKLICGMNLEEPIEEAVTLTSEEKTEAVNLFNSILLQWKEMNNTSIENFQRTFLQRDGVMFKKDENWNVVVGKSTFDVLLLKLPWGLSMIKYPWNKYLILVEWKAMN